MPTVSDYIVKLLSYEIYAFSWEELLQNTLAPVSTLRKELSRLAKRKEILNLRKGFYLVIPPRYRVFGKLPVELYIDKLFDYANKPYYISFYSAASYYEASHQQIQQDYIMSSAPSLRDIRKGNVKIRFFKTSKWPEKNISQVKSDAGYYNISSPALTFTDLVCYQAQLGGINRMLPIIEELAEGLIPEDMADLLSWYPINSVLQRMGFLLEYLGLGKEHTNLIHQSLIERKFYPVLLSPGKERKAGRTGNRWKIDMNLEFDTDLT